MEKIIEYKRPATTDSEFMVTVEVFHIVGKYLLEATGESLSLLELQCSPHETTDRQATEVRKILDLPACSEIKEKHLYLAKFYNVINTHKI